MFSLESWHERFQQQAAWTSSLRRYLLEITQAKNAALILEVGCGTGALTSDLHAQTPAQIFGVDIDLPRLEFARKADPQSQLACADGLRLPFPAASFDLTLCHYFLLWVARQGALAALAEMRRVTRPGGWVLALAEPDYGGRVDYPAELADLGKLQTQALRAQGADPEIGRRLPALLLQAGLKEVRSGVVGGEWQHPGAPAPQEDHTSELESDVLAHDLRDRISPAEMARYRAIEASARQSGERLLFVPTFYAYGVV
ncbi:MAG TPA: class I SAM-dependent methyltransferase [Anaerolineaceae bacterium]|nr:class I SAM-dependent methyltransferase [Anaerolineaceae bacterium]